jgi:hypothetical protein
MGAIFVVVGNVFGQQPFQVTFIEGNDVVQEVAAATAHPALRNTVLPGTSEGSPDRAHLYGVNGCGDFQSVVGIPIENDEARGRIKRERLPQLLNNPKVRGMPRDVAVQNTSAIMADDEEAVEHGEGDRGNREDRAR